MFHRLNKILVLCSIKHRKMPPKGAGSSVHATASTSLAELNPRTTHYEWMGPWGPLVIVPSLPVTVAAINALCSATTCSVASAPRVVSLVIDEFHLAAPHISLALIVELLWIGFHAALYLSHLGEVVPGLPLRTGKKLNYNINGLNAFVICHALAFVLHYVGLINLGWIADMFFPLAIAAIIISTAGSVLLYVTSFRSGALLALGGNTGNPIYDFWVGRELNPRTGELDWKCMCELRPGLIGWSLIAWSFAVRAMQEGTLTPAHVLVCVFQSWYVLDAFWFESAIASTMDITTDGFGFMLCFGDLAWVPFLYTLQSKFLYHWPQYHELTYLIPVALLNVLGYIVFRGANNEKDRFRKDPKDPRVAHLKTLQTQRGTRLIVSGYWGVCRHPNYVGDWCMTLAQCLLCGTGHMLPFFQAVYFAALLIHRQLRDEDTMLAKYGKKDWEAYCSHVPCRLIPYLY